MRTVSAKHPKGQEPPRTIGDDLRLLKRIAMMGFDYFVRGRKLRNAFYARKRTKEKLYVDEADWV